MDHRRCQTVYPYLTRFPTSTSPLCADRKFEKSYDTGWVFLELDQNTIFRIELKGAILKEYSQLVIRIPAQDQLLAKYQEP